MKIKFTRSILHKGEHKEAGESYDFPEGDAKFYLMTGDAVEDKGKSKEAKPDKEA